MDAVTIEAALPRDAVRLANLLELYIHDLSAAFPDIPMGPDGRFGYRRLSYYWEQPDRYLAFLIRYGDKLAGFALVTREPTGDMDVAEFFVLRRYRRSSIGRAAANLVWKRFPGKWTVRVSEGNENGVPFWRKVVIEFTNGTAVETGEPGSPHPWRIFSFET